MSLPNIEDELNTGWDLFMAENEEQLRLEYIQQNYKDFKMYCDDAFGNWCAEYQDVEKEKMDNLHDDLKQSLTQWNI